VCGFFGGVASLCPEFGMTSVSRVNKHHQLQISVPAIVQRRLISHERRRDSVHRRCAPKRRCTQVEIVFLSLNFLLGKYTCSISNLFHCVSKIRLHLVCAHTDCDVLWRQRRRELRDVAIKKQQQQQPCCSENF
jgi:hypothetical protein